MLNGKILFVRSCSYVPLLLLCIGGHISGLCFLCHLYRGGGGGGEYAQKLWIYAFQAMTIMADPPLFSLFQLCGSPNFSVCTLCLPYRGRGGGLYAKNKY